MKKFSNHIFWPHG
ncbi:hypothetical protein EW638_03715 [Porphyromonas gingivalis]|nr:hypothetical protein EW638_03715 [Porphyromonas gingivalis]